MRSFRLVLAVTVLTACQSSPGQADPARGEAVFVSRDKGHCLLCHQLQNLDQPSQGNLGPDLTNIGDRMSVAELTQRIADSRVYNPNTIMPAYHSTAGLHQVAQRYKNQPVLSATEVADIAEFLSLQRARRDTSR